MMVQNQILDRFSGLGARTGNADEAHDGTVTAGLPQELAELALGVEPLLLETNDDAHPPDTGGKKALPTDVSELFAVLADAVSQTMAPFTGIDRSAAGYEQLMAAQEALRTIEARADFGKRYLSNQKNLLPTLVAF